MDRPANDSRSIRYSRLRSMLDATATVLVIVASLAVITLVASLWQRSHNEPPEVANGTDASVPKEPQPLGGAAKLGDDAARVASVQFADFECVFCAQFARDTWPAIRTNYIASGQVLAIFRHLPLANHRYARSAAVSAACAGLQGKFWQMHDRLYLAQPQLSHDTGRSLAVGLGLDPAAFNECSESALDSVESDLSLARDVGISSTPAFLIGIVQPDQTLKTTHIILRAQPLARFEAVFHELLGKRSRNSWFGLR